MLRIDEKKSVDLWLAFTQNQRKKEANRKKKEGIGGRLEAKCIICTVGANTDIGVRRTHRAIKRCHRLAGQKRHPSARDGGSRQTGSEQLSVELCGLVMGLSSCGLLGRVHVHRGRFFTVAGIGGNTSSRFDHVFQSRTHRFVCGASNITDIWVARSEIHIMKNN